LVLTLISENVMTKRRMILFKELVLSIISEF